MQDKLMYTEIQHRILDGAERLLGRLGYQKMTIDDIAQAAGVARRTIYLHFENKEEVALCTIDRIVERLVERLEAIARSETPPDTKLRQMLLTRVIFRLESVQDYYLNFDDLFATLRPAYLARRNRYFEAEIAPFCEVIAAGQEKRVFAESDPRAVARTLLLMTNSLLPYSLSPRELGVSNEIERQVDEIASLALTGLYRRGADPGSKEDLR
jgi:AcrR family transcriptional regulator